MITHILLMGSWTEMEMPPVGTFRDLFEGASVRVFLQGQVLKQGGLSFSGIKMLESRMHGIKCLLGREGAQCMFVVEWNFSQE